MAAACDIQLTGIDSHHVAFSRIFFNAWQQRNEIRQLRWEEKSVFSVSKTASSTAQLHFTSLHQKIQLLKDEIMNLVEQDTALFEQLFALQDAILDLKESLEYSTNSSGASSPYLSQCSRMSSCSSLHKEDNENDYLLTKKSSSFVRQQVSYPPISRNRSRRMKADSSYHHYQNSYDSGIHTSDQEIFV